jgi:hypothetical protein
MKKKYIVLSLCLVLLIFGIILSRKLIINVFTGKIEFPKQHIGKTLTSDDGQSFVVIRRLKVNSRIDDTKHPAIFLVKFKFKSLKIKTNKRLSMIPAPFLIGMTGFREKYWTINEKTDHFQGIYQWESKEIAEKYPESFIFNMMTKRAKPGTVHYEIIADTHLSDYIENHLSKQK